MSFAHRARSEFAYASGLVRMLRRVTPVAKARDRVWPDVVADLADRFGDRTALISEEETLSYRDYHRRGNRYARWAQAHGVGKGDCVALFMPNRAEYLAIWLGITRAGGVVALVNTNLTGPSLAHCIAIVKPKHVIVASDLAGAFETARPHLAGGPEVWSFGPSNVGSRLDDAIAETSDEDLPPEMKPALTIEDRCLYIYTSGTTGLPKAANINHYRVQAIMNGFSAATRATGEDRMYVSLPLYHTSGGVLAVGTVLTVGGSVVIARKFSAGRFWDDIVRHDCTMFQYIGELCRYLVNSPPHPKERQHRIRIVSGNGLRPDIWLPFKSRFGIPRILEWYAATEGNAALFNMDGQPGSIGRVPKWIQRRFPIKVVKTNLETGEMLRDLDGHAIECAPDEVGEMVSEIVNDPAKPAQRFEGYADPAATARKIAENLFRPGDRWFRTGDLVRKDALGYFYFVDRIGDTFRWKGENVATSEVSEALGVYPGIATPNVYGVTVPGREGRAGMAAIVCATEIDLDGLSRHLDSQLPAYAKPIFLRIKSDIEVTGTFKLKKLDLVEEGFDPDRIADPIFFLHPAEKRYVRLDGDLYRAIVSGGIRL
ncbi:long-chain-acyl-CoA synthetase [Chthonobacter rhizosphaerae]|uniref:long-chain-acyl-CoA synthetase n=1 Tax=Chthonobacter rhizosphaerae TaxID=2735553 RepID=UPI0015EE5ADD|nr:long-chain-acyl-CoA synthetase [Chthonobacter rhizosphaerae]